MLDRARELMAFARGKSLSDLQRDRILELAVMRLLEVIGEGARRVSEERRAAHPEVPWTDVWGMRNALIHVYDNVDLVRVWRTIEVDVPVLIAALERMLP